MVGAESITRAKILVNPHPHWLATTLFGSRTDRCVSINNIRRHSRASVNAIASAITTRLAIPEHMFDTRVVLSAYEIENMRRSAAMSSLSIDDQRHLLDACAEMAQERAQIAAVLAELPTSWRNARAALNELQRLMGQ